MRTVFFIAIVLLTVPMPAVAADAAVIGKGAKVLPKQDAVVKVGNTIVDPNDLSLPWTVQDVNGDWLWVGDSRKGWVQRGQVVPLDEASAYYTQFINNDTLKNWAYYNRGIAARLTGNLDSAIADLGELLRLKPSAPIYEERGNIWREKKDYAKAIADYNNAFHLAPSDADTFNDAAWLRATATDDQFRDGKKAVELATKANELTGWANSQYLDTLAVAYAAAGDFDAAIKHETKAIALSPTVEEIKQRLQLFQDKKPYRQP